MAILAIKVTRRFISKLEEHPLPRFLDAGINACVNTDDPAIFGVDLVDEFMNVRQSMGVDRARLGKLIQNGIYATFLPKAEQDALWKKAAKIVDPFMDALGRPTLFCHSLVIEENGRIADYVLRHPDHKRATAAAFRALNFEVAAVGDSYNDTRMLEEADIGILFRAPENVLAEFPQFSAVREYAELEDLLTVPD